MVIGMKPYDTNTILALLILARRLFQLDLHAMYNRWRIVENLA